jgi:tetratricopeptide (TPR) repeat protein
MLQQSRTWPVLSGVVPPLAESFIQRPETGHGPWDGLYPGHTVVLHSGGDPGVLAGRCGGTGKTQLAAAFAIKLWSAGELDLLVWVQAVSRAGIISGYASALADVKVAGPPGKPEAAASRFLAWLATTGRRWLVVLDGLADAADAEGLWPHGPSGQVLVTTRLSDLTPGSATSRATRRAVAPAAESQAIDVPAFSQREAINYISARLTDDPYQAAGSPDLAIAMGGQPVALALATAYLHDSGQNCRQYQMACARYSQAHADLVTHDPLAPFWMLSIDRARQLALGELAWPALRLAAVFGPVWIPGAVLTNSAACAYITGRPGVSRQDQASVQAAFGNLARLDLVRIEPDDEIRTVLMSGALQSSVRRAMGPAELRKAVRAAADALSESWPKCSWPALDRALGDCVAGLKSCDELALWGSDCHPLLFRVGQSLDDAKMADTAFSYWRDLARRSIEHIGARSARTLAIRERLAHAATTAGRRDDAVDLHSELAADLQKAAGPTHPQAIVSRASLAVALRAAGRLSEAISLGERVVADSESVFGPAHAQTTGSLLELGSAYAEAKRHAEAIHVARRCLTVREQALGLMHPETISARRHLGQAHHRAGQANQAIALYERALTMVEKAVGAAHPDTVTAREDLAIAYYDAGRADKAVTTFEQALTEWQQIPGTGATATMTARANLAALYYLNGRIDEAIKLYQSEHAELERIKGAHHRDTLRTRWNLAAASHKAKRLSEAIQLGEATLSDCEQVLGPGHWDTLTSRANLAHAYHAAGLLKGASAQFDRALRDCERSLGPEDPLTEKVRALRKRYLAGRQGATPIITLPGTART